MMPAKTISRVELNQMLRDLCRIHGSMDNAAKKIGINKSHLSRLISGAVEPGEKVLGYLKLATVVRYRRVDTRPVVIHPFRPNNRAA